MRGKEKEIRGDCGKAPGRGICNKKGAKKEGDRFPERRGECGRAGGGENLKIGNTAGAG